MLEVYITSTLLCERHDSLSEMIFFIILTLWLINGHVIVGDMKISSENSIYHIEPDVFFEITHPPELEYTYRIKPAKDFGAPFNASFSKKKIALVPTVPSTNCRLPSNAEDLVNKIALIERGECSFQLKTAIAQKAGAVAAIISDHLISMEEDRTSPMWMDYQYIEMTSDDSDIADGINIPAGFLLGRNGRMIRKTLEKLELPFAIINIPVNVTFRQISEYRQPPWMLV